MTCGEPVTGATAHRLARDLPRVVARILAGMGSVADLQASVAAAYNLLEMPSWPDPHPG
jgi:hypothetical protein